jgi:hypothetical protein
VTGIGNELIKFEEVTAVEKDENCKKCCVIVNDKVCIQADIKIDPDIAIGEIKTVCEDPIVGKCCRVPCSHDSCEFSVSQTICVEIPLTFLAVTHVVPAGHICGTPELHHECT